MKSLFPLPVSFTQSRDNFTTDGTDGADESRAVRISFRSVKSVKSAVRFFCLGL